MRVGVFGAAGRVGTTVCDAVDAAEDMELVAAVDPAAAGRELGGAAGGVVIGASPEVIGEAGAEVAVDFTNAPSAMQNLRWCAHHGVHAVVGTTGFSEADVEALGKLFGGGQVNCVLAPNFAVGAVLMMRFAEMAAPHMEGAEIVELHHGAKLDAPSGTAVATAAAIGRAGTATEPGGPGGDAAAKETMPGARGAMTPAGIRVHSVRLTGLVSHQEVVFGAAGQSLTIRHDSYDRSSFVPGVLLAIRCVGSRPGLTVGLGPLLGV